MSEADKIIKSLRDSGKKVEEFYMSNKTSDKNVANIEDDIKLVKRYLENSAYKETDSDFFKNGGWEMVDLEIPKAIEKLLQDYTRQKQINEEHKKINGELREKVKELEEKNKHLSNTSDYETISLECTNLEEQLEIANNRIQELEEENYVRKIQIYEKSIAKEKVIEAFEDIEDYFDRLNGPDENMDYIRQVKQELLEGEK